MSLGDTLQGKKAVEDAINFFLEQKDAYPATMLLNALAQVKFQQEDFADAITQAGRSHLMAKRDKLSDQKIEASNLLAESFEALHKWDSAYFYSQLTQAYKDSLNLEKAHLEIGNMRTTYELSKQEATLEKLRYTNRTRLLTLGMLGLGLLLVATFSIALYRRNILVRKVNQTLDKQKSLLEENEKIISRSLEEKETLLKEIHHRVKNNLQIVSSLLSLQSSSTHDEQSIQALNEGRNRVESIALIHQKLYSHDDLSHIDIRNYIEQLANIVLNTVKPSGPGQKPVSLTVESRDLMLEMDVAVPLGLIVNELLTNSCKYAFSPEISGHIRIEFSEAEKEGFMVMTYSDNGKGLPSDFDISKASSLGLRLVQILSRQLHGQADFDTSNSNGARFHIQFKKSDVK
ncbi:sensor histidine kinase [Fulvitalea axinellae]